MGINDAAVALGQFGRLRINVKGCPIEVWGWVREIDKKRLLFEDNHDNVYIYKIADCDFNPAKFKILTEHKS
jgi:hypothetical protein